VPTIEKNVLQQRRDVFGNDVLLYPVTKTDNVFDLTPEKIGAAPAEHSHPGGILFTADFSSALSNVIITDGVLNTVAGRIEAGGS